MTLKISGNLFGLGETYGRDFAAQLANLVVMLLHLAEVRAARGSSEMAQEDQHERARVDFGELGWCAIRVKE